MLKLCPPVYPPLETVSSNQLPVADDAGRCNEANFVGFGIPVPAKQGEENSCSREVDNLESQCSSVFGWGRFSSQLYAATDGAVAPAPVIVAGEYIPVKQGNAKRSKTNTSWAGGVAFAPSCVAGGR